MVTLLTIFGHSGSSGGGKWSDISKLIWTAKVRDSLASFDLSVSQSSSYITWENKPLHCYIIATWRGNSMELPCPHVEYSRWKLCLQSCKVQPPPAPPAYNNGLNVRYRSRKHPDFNLNLSLQCTLTVDKGLSEGARRPPLVFSLQYL